MGANILIVEDEEPLTTLLRYNLEAEGYEVDLALRVNVERGHQRHVAQPPHIDGTPRFFCSKFLADHPGDRAAPGTAEEDRGVNEQQQERIFVSLETWLTRLL